MSAMPDHAADDDALDGALDEAIGILVEQRDRCRADAELLAQRADRLDRAIEMLEGLDGDVEAASPPPGFVTVAAPDPAAEDDAEVAGEDDPDDDVAEDVLDGETSPTPAAAPALSPSPRAPPPPPPKNAPSLTPAERAVLKALDAVGVTGAVFTPASYRQIVESSGDGVPLGSVSYVVQKLIDKRLIVAGSSEGQVKTYRFTDAGARLV